MGLFSIFGLAAAQIVPIGEGVSGRVDLCEKNHNWYVVKTYHSKESHESRKEYRNRVLQEYNVLQLLLQENFIKVYKYTVLLDGLTVKMYMEAGTKDLAQLFKSARSSQITKAEIYCLWKQLCIGVHYLHSRGLCHRDLKLENLVMDRNSNTLKILDMATACKSGNGQNAVGTVGSKSYMAPETYAKISYDGQHADLWSVAIIFFYFVNQSFPWVKAVMNDERYAAFATQTEGECSVLDEPVYNEHGFEIGPNKVLKTLPEESVDLASHLFVIDPKLRYDANDVVSNAWFRLLPCCERGSLCGQNHVIGRSE